MKLMTGLSFNNLIEFYQNKHNVRFDNSRIHVLRCIFAKGVDISRYADPKYDNRQLSEIYAGLNYGIDISVYSHTNYSNVQMMFIRQGLEDSIDVTYFLDSELDPYQLQMIDVGLRKKLDVSKYANSQLSFDEMKSIFIELEKQQEMLYRNQLFANSVSFKAIIEEYESKHDTQLNLSILKELFDSYTKGVEITDDTITQLQSVPRLKTWYEI